MSLTPLVTLFFLIGYCGCISAQILDIQAATDNSSITLDWSAGPDYKLTKADSISNLRRGFFVEIDSEEVTAGNGTSRFNDSVDDAAFYQLLADEDISRPINILCLHGVTMNGNAMSGGSPALLPLLQSEATSGLKNLARRNIKFYYPSGTHRPSYSLMSSSNPYSLVPGASTWRNFKAFAPLPIRLSLSFGENTMISWYLVTTNARQWYDKDFTDGAQDTMIQNLITYANESIQGDVDFLLGYSEGGSVATNLMSAFDEYSDYGPSHPHYLGNLKNLKGAILVNPFTAEGLYAAHNDRSLIPSLQNYTQSNYWNSFNDSSVMDPVTGQNTLLNHEGISDMPDEYSKENFSVLTLIANGEEILTNPIIEYITGLYTDNELIYYDGNHSLYWTTGVPSFVDDQTLDWIFKKYFNED